MFVSIIIIAFSIALFLYWFRYTCLMILNTKTVKDYTAQIATANQLEFPTIQSQLRMGYATTHLDTLHASLDRDYRLVTGLLQHAAQFQVGGVNIEQRMLMIDYKVMKVWYSAARHFSKGSHAMQALQEMSEIVAHFANTMGERASTASCA
jgi:hypothetical protein